MDEIKSAEIEFRQDSSLVAWIQTAAGKDRHKNYYNRRTLYQIFNIRQEFQCDIRQWTWNRPARQQHSLTTYAANIAIDPLLHVDSCWLLQQYFKVPRTLLWESWNPSSMRHPGWSWTKERSTASFLYWGINSTGFPFVNVSISRSQSSFTTPSMIPVQHTSAEPVFLFRRSEPGLTCDLL